jgi:hypothetical protein
MGDDEAVKHEKYFLTQKDIEDKTKSVNTYENMKKVHDYDQIMADKHPEIRSSTIRPSARGNKPTPITETRSRASCTSWTKRIFTKRTDRERRA